MKGNKGEGRKNEWERSETETENERLLTLGNEEGEVGRGMGWLGDRHWGGHLMGWALGAILYVGKLNTNKNKFIIKKQKKNKKQNKQNTNRHMIVKLLKAKNNIHMPRKTVIISPNEHQKD